MSEIFESGYTVEREQDEERQLRLVESISDGDVRQSTRQRAFQRICSSLPCTRIGQYLCELDLDELQQYLPGMTEDMACSISPEAWTACAAFLGEPLMQAYERWCWDYEEQALIARVLDA